MWWSKADIGPPGTVTTTRHPGARYAAALRINIAGSSTCSSTSEQTACVAHPARSFWRRAVLHQVAGEKARARDLLGGDVYPPLAVVRATELRVRVCAVQVGDEVALAAADVQHPTPSVSELKQIEDQLAPEALGGIARGGFGIFVPMLVPVILRDRGQGHRAKPAACASRWNIFTVSSE